MALELNLDLPQYDLGVGELNLNVDDVPTGGGEWWQKLLGIIQGWSWDEPYDWREPTFQFRLQDFVATAFSATDPATFFIITALNLLKNVPTWVKSCEETHAKATSIFEQFQRAEVAEIANQKMKPVVSVRPYDSRPQAATLSLGVEGNTGTDVADLKPEWKVQTLKIGQDQNVKVSWDLSSEYWSSLQSCQAEWSWVRIISNVNGSVKVWLSEFAKAQGGLTQGTQGKNKSDKTITLPAGEYLVIVCCTGDTPYKVLPRPGESHARVVVEYAVPRPVSGILGIGANLLPWLLVGAGTLTAGYLAVKAFKGSSRSNRLNKSNKYTKDGNYTRRY